MNRVTTPVQVYVQSESSEKHQSAAKEALHDHCKPLLHLTAATTSPMLSDTMPLGSTPTNPSSTLGTPAQQLSLVKACAWPFPVTASHFADAAAMTTLARDAALWEAYCAALAAGCGAEQQHVLQLLWKAAACFAERASSGDRAQRQLWSALTAAGMQVSAARQLKVRVSFASSTFLVLFLYHQALPWQTLPCDAESQDDPPWCHTYDQTLDSRLVET